MIFKTFFTFIFCYITLSANELVLSGNIVSSNEKTITSRNIGFVKKVYVKEGEHVLKNQLLFELDDENIKSAKQELLLTHTMQENELENITRNLQRQQRLLSQDLVAKYDVEQLQLRHKNLQQALQITQAKLQEIQNEYNYLKLKAPNDALVVKKSINEGEMLMPGVPALVLTDLNALEVHLNIGESYIQHIQTNQTVSIDILALNIQVQSPIEAIIPNSTATHRGFIVKIPLPKIKNAYPGMYAEVTFSLKSQNE